MPDWTDLSRRIGHPAADKAWRAHLEERNNQLRAKYGKLVTDGKSDA